MTLFLTSEEIIQLTGYRRPKKQIAWLEKHKVDYYVRADGYPSVPRDGLKPKLTPPQHFEPDWSGVAR